jgi:hypothetical protein
MSRWKCTTGSDAVTSNGTQQVLMRTASLCRTQIQTQAARISNEDCFLRPWLPRRAWRDGQRVRNRYKICFCFVFLVVAVLVMAVV